MSDKSGYINIHRKILDHWVCSSKHSYSQLEAWLDILLNVNQDNGKPILIDGTHFTPLRGQSLYSLDTWGKRWRWDKSKVRRFFDKLQKDQMIVINNEKKTTRLTVCNYDTYQSKRHSTDTRPTPNNILLSKDSNINTRREVFKVELSAYLQTYSKDKLNAFYKYWSELNKSKTKMKFEMEKTWELSLRLSRWKDDNTFSKRETTTHLNTVSDN